MSVYDWPLRLGARGIAFNPRGQTLSGPPSLKGQSQVASVDAGYWIASLDQIPTAIPAKVKLFRALTALLEGGAHQIRVPAFDCTQAPWPIVGGVPLTSYDDVTYDDDSEHDDDTPFYQPVIDIVAAAAAARATALDITINLAGDLIGGELFTSGDNRLHVIKRIDPLTSGGDYRISIWPPLREAIEEPVRLNFDRPVCLMRLASEQAADLSLAMGRFGMPDMTFIEAF